VCPVEAPLICRRLGRRTDDDCKATYEALPQLEKDKYGYEYDLMVLLERLVQQCDSRVKKHTDRIRSEHLAELDAIG